jgi:hypothetical protein
MSKPVESLGSKARKHAPTDRVDTPPSKRLDQNQLVEALDATAHSCNKLLFFSLILHHCSVAPALTYVCSFASCNTFFELLKV